MPSTHRGGHDEWGKQHVEGSLLLHLVEGRNFDAALQEKRRGASLRSTTPGKALPVKHPASSHNSSEVLIKVTRRGDKTLVAPKKHAAQRVPYDCKMEVTSPPAFDLLKGKLEVELTSASSGETIAKANVGLSFLVNVESGQTHTVDLLVVPDDPKMGPIKLPKGVCPGVKFVIYQDFPHTSPRSAMAGSRRKQLSFNPQQSIVQFDDNDDGVPTPEDAPLPLRAVPPPLQTHMVPRSPTRENRSPPKQRTPQFIEVSIIEGSGCTPLGGMGGGGGGGGVPSNGPKTHCKVQVTFHGRTLETDILTGSKPHWRQHHIEERRTGRHRSKRGPRSEILRFKNTKGEKLEGNYAHIRLYCAYETVNAEGVIVNGPWQMVGTVDVELGHLLQYATMRLEDTWVALDSEMNSRLLPRNGGATNSVATVPPARTKMAPGSPFSSHHKSPVSFGPSSSPPRSPRRADKAANNTVQTAVAESSRAWLCIAVALTSEGTDPEMPFSPQHNSIVRARGAPPPPPLLKELVEGKGTPLSPMVSPSKVVRNQVFQSEVVMKNLAKAAEGIWQEKGHHHHPMPGTPQIGGAPLPEVSLSPISPITREGRDMSSRLHDSLGDVELGTRQSSVPRGREEERLVDGGVRGESGGGGGGGGGGGVLEAFMQMQSRGVSPPRLQPTWGIATSADVLSSYLISLGIEHGEVRKITVVLAKCGVKDVASLLQLSSSDVMKLPVSFACKKKLTDGLG